MKQNANLRVNPAVAALAPYVPGEQPREAGFIKLNTNENPYPPAPDVERALQAAMQERSLQKYPDPHCTRLRETIADRLDVEPANVLVGNGSDEVLRLICHAYLDGAAGDCIAMLYPTYVLYRTLAAMFGAGCREFRLEPPHYTFPDPAYETSARIFFLANPNPPIGTLYGHDVIRRLAEARPDRLVVIDEAYVDFAGMSAVALVQEYPNVAVTRTFSKSYSLAGMRVGFVVANVEIITELEKIKDSYNVNRLSQVAAEAAWSATDYYNARMAEICTTRETLRRELIARGFDVPESHGNFVFARHPLGCQIYQRLKDRKILVRYFNMPLLDDGVRITIGTPEEIHSLLEAIDGLLGECSGR